MNKFKTDNSLSKGYFDMESLKILHSQIVNQIENIKKQSLNFSWYKSASLKLAFLKKIATTLEEFKQKLDELLSSHSKSIKIRTERGVPINEDSLKKEFLSKLRRLCLSTLKLDIKFDPENPMLDIQWIMDNFDKLPVSEKNVKFNIPTSESERKEEEQAYLREFNELFSKNPNWDEVSLKWAIKKLKKSGDWMKTYSPREDKNIIEALKNISAFTKIWRDTANLTLKDFDSIKDLEKFINEYRPPWVEFKDKRYKTEPMPVRIERNISEEGDIYDLFVGKSFSDYRYLGAGGDPDSSISSINESSWCFRASPNYNDGLKYAKCYLDFGLIFVVYKNGRPIYAICPTTCECKNTNNGNMWPMFESLYIRENGEFHKFYKKIKEEFIKEFPRIAKNEERGRPPGYAINLDGNEDPSLGEWLESNTSYYLLIRSKFFNKNEKENWEMLINFLLKSKNPEAWEELINSDLISEYDDKKFILLETIVKNGCIKNYLGNSLFFSADSLDKTLEIIIELGSITSLIHVHKHISEEYEEYEEFKSLIINRIKDKLEKNDFKEYDIKNFSYLLRDNFFEKGSEVYEKIIKEMIIKGFWSDISGVEISRESIVKKILNEYIDEVKANDIFNYLKNDVIKPSDGQIYSRFIKEIIKKDKNYIKLLVGCVRPEHGEIYDYMIESALNDWSYDGVCDLALSIANYFDIDEDIITEESNYIACIFRMMMDGSDQKYLMSRSINPEIYRSVFESLKDTEGFLNPLFTGDVKRGSKQYENVIKQIVLLGLSNMAIESKLSDNIKKDIEEISKYRIDILEENKNKSVMALKSGIFSLDSEDPEIIKRCAFFAISQNEMDPSDILENYGVNFFKSMIDMFRQNGGDLLYKSILESRRIKEKIDIIGKDILFDAILWAFESKSIGVLENFIAEMFEINPDDKTWYDFASQYLIDNPVYSFNIFSKRCDTIYFLGSEERSDVLNSISNAIDSGEIRESNILSSGIDFLHCGLSCDRDNFLFKKVCKIFIRRGYALEDRFGYDFVRKLMIEMEDEEEKIKEKELERIKGLQQELTLIQNENIENIENVERVEEAISFNWYRFGQEFVGSDSAMSSGQNIMDTVIRNTDNQFLPGSLGAAPPGTARDELALTMRSPARSNSDVPVICPVCKRKITEKETMKGFKDSHGKTVYRCTSCGYTNNPYKRTVTLKKPSRIKKRRASSTERRIFASPPVSQPGGNSWYNPANTPWGRLDLTEDQRVIFWNRIHDGFEEEWDFRKQKNNRENKVVKIKDKKGKIRIFKVKKNNTFGDAVQPSNVQNQKGRVRKQNRYRSDDPHGKEHPGAWPQQRNPTPDHGFYQSPANKNTFDADGRTRYMDWNSYISDRNTSLLTLTKPI